MGLGSRASPRSSRRRGDDGGAAGLSSPESQSSASFSLGATPSPRKSNRRLSPRRRNTEDGYLDLIGGRAVQQGGKETKGGSGASFTSPLNLASSQEEGGTGEGGGDDGQQAGPSVSGGDEEGGPRVGAKKTKSRSKTKGKGSARLEASTKLWGNDGEKTAFHLLVQEFCPSQFKKRNNTKAAWLKILQRLRDEQHTLRLTDRDGSTREVVVNMGPTMEGQTEDQLITKLKNGFDADRRAFLETQDEEEKKTGEGKTDPDDITETTEEAELKSAIAAWQSGKALRQDEKTMKTVHSAKGQSIRQKAADSFSAGRQERGGSRKRASAGGAGKGKARASSDAPSSDSSDDGRRRSDSSFDSSAGESRPRRDAKKRTVAEDSSSDDSDGRREHLDRVETKRASGKGGRSTRDGKGGGSRKRRVAPLSAGGVTTGLEGQVMGIMEEIMHDRRAARTAQGAGAAGGGSGSGGGVTRAEMQEAVQGAISGAVSRMEDRVATAVAQALRGHGVGGNWPQQPPPFGHRAAPPNWTQQQQQQQPPFAQGAAQQHSANWQQHQQPPPFAQGAAQPNWQQQHQQQQQPPPFAPGAAQHHSASWQQHQQPPPPFAQGDAQQDPSHQAGAPRSAPASTVGETSMPAAKASGGPRGEAHTSGARSGVGTGGVESGVPAKAPGAAASSAQGRGREGTSGAFMAAGRSGASLPGIGKGGGQQSVRPRTCKCTDANGHPRMATLSTGDVQGGRRYWMCSTPNVLAKCNYFEDSGMVKDTSGAGGSGGGGGAAGGAGEGRTSGGGGRVAGGGRSGRTPGFLAPTKASARRDKEAKSSRVGKN